MDDVNEKLNALLSDPGSMAQIMQLAQQLSGSMGGDTTQPPPYLRHLLRRSRRLRHWPAIDPQVITKYLPLLQELTRDTSQTTQLLYALRPFLKDGKQDKVERAARLARLITIGKRFLDGRGRSACITATFAATMASIPAFPWTKRRRAPIRRRRVLRHPRRSSRAPERGFFNDLLEKLHLGDLDAGDLLLLFLLFYLSRQKADEELLIAIGLLLIL